jgi:glucosylceramidase
MGGENREMNTIQKITYFDETTGEIRQENRTVSFVKESELEKQVESNVVGLYPDYLFQKIDGFGCAMTETACYLLSRMSAETRREALKCWFGSSGIQAGFVRIHIDSCDYSLEEYQAVEDPVKDPELTTFSISRDKKYIIPVMKEVLEISDQPISVLLSPWSPPVQWKTPPEIQANDGAVYGGSVKEVDFSKPNRCFGGRLKPEYYPSWAKYLVLYIQAYLDEGIPVTMLSVQNEANAATSWDSCVWSGEEEKEFLQNYLYPEMQKSGLTEKVGIYIWDHNKERMIEHIDAMMDESTGKMVQGFAYHWYSGDHFQALSLLHEKYPEKILMHSESCGLHIPGKAMPFTIPDEAVETLPEEFRKLMKKAPLEVDFSDAKNYAHDLIGDINHGMNRWIDWNMIVDRTGGPRHVPGGFAAPIVAEDDGTYTTTVSYVYIKEIAKTIRPGARRIGMSTYSSRVEAAAVKNTDGSIGVVFLNQEKRKVPIVMRMDGWLCQTELPAETISTFSLQLEKKS